MATVRLLRSTTPGNTPSSLVPGQIAINEGDGKLFYRNSAGAVTLLSDPRWALFLPAAPTGLTATPGNAQATVSWTAPTGVLAQAPVTDYVVQVSSDSGSNWSTFSDGTSTATSATVTGLQNNTAYVFRAAAVNGIGTGAYSTASTAVTPVAGDPLWANVQLLLPGNTTVNDASSYSRSVAAVGAASSAAQSRFGGGSISFNGSGQYLTVADNAALELGGSDFAIECWLRTSQTTAYATIASRGTGFFESGSWSLMLNASGTGSVAVYASDFSTGAPLLSTSGINVSDGAWHHVAWVRSGTGHSLYVDGTRYANATSSFAVTNISELLAIGTDLIFSGRNFSGFIDDFRYTVGTNRGYTGATITVPAAAFPTVGTGGVATDGYFSSVSLLLPGDTSTADMSSFSRSVTASGASVSTAQKRWGTGSIALGGSAWLTVPQASVSLGSSDFVIECWFYMTAATGGYKTLWAQRPNSSSIGGAAAVLDGSSLLYFISNASASGWAVSGASTGLTVPAAQWNHIAMVRSGNTVTLYLNGTAGTPVSLSEAVGSSGNFSIGAGAANGEQAVTGFMDDFRLTVGSNRGYTGATINVPTAAFPSSGNYSEPFLDKVSLLLRADGSGNTFIDSSLSPKTITASGNATQSATQSRWGGKSAFFTGTSRLSSSTSSAFSFGDGDFVVEMWVYPSGASGFQTLFSTRSSDTNQDSNNVFLGLNTGTLTPIVYTNGLVLSGSSSLSAGAWSHIAFVRESGVVSIYLNGTRIGSASFTTSITGTNASVGLTQNSEHQFSGYIDDVRVTSGSNRGYTGATITVPTAAFPTS